MFGKNSAESTNTFRGLLNYVKKSNENRDCRKTPPTSEAYATFLQRFKKIKFPILCYCKKETETEIKIHKARIFLFDDLRTLLL